MLRGSVPALDIPAGASASTITQVMHGLDNAKGLAFGPEGALYVTEAGRGGPASGPCWTSPRPDLGFRCYGATGAISRYLRGAPEKEPAGGAAPGESGLSRPATSASAPPFPRPPRLGRVVR